MPYTPQPLPLSFIVFLFNMPNLPSGPNLPNVGANMPSINGPSFSGPSVGPNGIVSPTFNGPSYHGPNINAPSYSGPNGGDGSSNYSGPSGRALPPQAAQQPKNHAGFWLGVLIFLWTLALISLIFLVLFLAKVDLNFNIFNYQRFKLSDVQTSFTNAGLEVTRPVTFTSSSNFNNPSINFSFVEGESFIIPSAGATGAGGILVFNNNTELNRAKDTLSDRTKNGNFPYFVYIRENVLVFLNVPEATAKKYQDALTAMR